MFLDCGMAYVVLPTRRMEHVPARKPTHSLSMLRLLLAKGTLVVVTLKDVGDHVEFL